MRHRPRISFVVSPALLSSMLFFAGVADVGAQTRDGLAGIVQASNPDYVTTQVCATCHRSEADLWRESHHAAAMRPATRDTVLAPFGGEMFTKDGITSTFFRKDGRFFVRSDGPDGTTADFEISYTFGITPLQQYLIAFTDGRLQAFGVAWDTRPASNGGQRWFHLYPDRRLAAGDPLHWTGIDQNWNYQCAWCHSTDLRKNYSPAADTYSTTWSEINVGCESCHGPGADHVAWARKPAAERAADEYGSGFALRFDERALISWTMRDSGTAVRSHPRTGNKEINVCAGCHARREQFSDAPHETAAFLGAFRPSLIERGLYYSDGQQRDEVYKYGSFLQSRMHAEGVTCSDCHEPHSGRLWIEGNGLCGQCHEAEKFDTARHHHHDPGTPGAACASCHMPTTNYMVVDARHDHSFRIPRPDLSVGLSVPNACNKCHSDRDAAWAASAIRQWYPDPKPGYQDFATIFAASDQGAPGSREALIRYLEQRRPAIAAASALARLARNPSRDALRIAAGALGSPDPLVTTAAIRVVELADAQTRLDLLAPLLTSGSRLVRIDVAQALAGEPESLMDGTTRMRFEDALQEYMDAQTFNAERPEANMNLANLYLQRQNPDEARRYFEIALTRDPSFAPATVGLAESLRGQGNEQASEKLLRDTLGRYPGSPELAHALGLSLVRSGKTRESVDWLRQAARLGQDNPRYAYVYAVALNDIGQVDEAVQELQMGLERHPYDRETLNALLSYELNRGNLRGALGPAETLAALEPDNAAIANLVEQIRRRLR